MFSDSDPFVALFIRTWKRTSRQYRRSEAGSDSKCDGWRPPVDSFTNLFAKQTAWTHPVIIADGVSSARSRSYLIFIMPSWVPSFYLSLLLLLSAAQGTDRAHFRVTLSPPSIFELYGCTLPRNYRWRLVPRIGGRVCHLDTWLEWNFRATRCANSFWFRITYRSFRDTLYANNTFLPQSPISSKKYLVFDI